MTDFDKLLDQGEKHARKVLLEHRDPELQGFYHLIAPEGGQDRVIMTRWRNDIEKQLTVLSIKATAREMRAVAMLVVYEAWMLKLKPSQEFLANTPRPSESPDRIEAVYLLATDGRNTKARMLQMLRDKPSGRITSLIEDKFPEGDSAFSGRLVDGIIVPSE